MDEPKTLLVIPIKPINAPTTANKYLPPPPFRDTPYLLLLSWQELYRRCPMERWHSLGAYVLMVVPPTHLSQAPIWEGVGSAWGLVKWNLLLCLRIT